MHIYTYVCTNKGFREQHLTHGLWTLIWFFKKLVFHLNALPKPDAYSSQSEKCGIKKPYRKLPVYTLRNTQLLIPHRASSGSLASVRCLGLLCKQVWCILLWSLHVPFLLEDRHSSFTLCAYGTFSYTWLFINLQRPYTVTTFMCDGRELVAGSRSSALGQWADLNVVKSAP